MSVPEQPACAAAVTVRSWRRSEPLLADGKSYSAAELCALCIEQKLLAPSTIPNYVQRDEPDDGPNIGAPFERDVTAAFTALGFAARRMGSQGEPDVVATAPLGDRAYTVVVECKTAAGADDRMQNPVVQEASRLCDLVGGTYAVLIGPGFPRAAETDGEVQPTASPSGRATIW